MVEAAVDQPAQSGKARRGRVLETDELSSVFGVDIDMDGVSKREVSPPVEPSGSARRASKARKAATPRAGSKTSAKKSAAAKAGTQKAKKRAAKKASSKSTPARRKRA
jgi:hypothetical protein